MVKLAYQTYFDNTVFFGKTGFTTDNTVLKVTVLSTLKIRFYGLRRYLCKTGFTNETVLSRIVYNV